MKFLKVNQYTFIGTPREDIDEVSINIEQISYIRRKDKCIIVLCNGNEIVTPHSMNQVLE
jgi:uncharacterized protein YlzI (FlbEa/FlbD family)